MTLGPVYLSALAGQLAALSAFLGGFAATFLATLLVADSRGRAAGWAIGAAALSSVAFVVTVVAATALVAQLHPDAPPMARAASSTMGRIVATLSFATGLYALLAAVGASGWVRSPRTGRTTATIAGLGGLVVTMLIVRLG